MSAAGAAAGAQITCPACGAAMPATAAVCPTCGAARIRPAGIGARLGALTVDLAAIVIVAAVVALTTRSLILAGVATAEAVLALWILQARTGASLGGALVRVRVVRVDKPFSPGGGRSLIRGLITTAGLCVLVVGAWVQEATGAGDRSGLRRSWADRAAGTAVLEVPRVTARAAAGSPVVQAGPRVPPTSFAPRAAPIPAAPAQPATPAPAAHPTPAAHPLPSAVPPSAVPEPVAFDPSPRPAVARVDDAASAPAPTRRSARVPTMSVILVFDTGQREVVPVPSAVNLGRSPNETQSGDVVIVVDDPSRTVSKTHARLENTLEGTWVTELGSTNGSALLDEDGSVRVLTANRRTFVEDGVRVRLGDRVITVRRMTGADS
jgi:hypothetical protein